MKKVLFPFILVACGLLALSGSAHASEAIMDSPQRVSFASDTFSGQNHRLTISRTPALPDGLVVKDRGGAITGHWRPWDSWGCETASVSDTDGSFPATCWSRALTRITSFRAYLDSTHVDWADGPDTFSVDPSAAGVAASVYADGGNDEVDIHDGVGNDLVDCGNGIDWAWSDPGDIEQGCETTQLGGDLFGGPAVASWGQGRLDVFWWGDPYVDLRHRWYDGAWSGEESLGGILTSAPAAVSWSFGRLDVFWRGMYGDLRHRWYDAGRWSAEESLGGYLRPGSSPAVSSWEPGRLDVFWRGNNFDLRHKWYASNRWFPEEGLGGHLASDPDAVSWGPNRIDIFAQGDNNSLVHRWYDHSWSGWERMDFRLPLLTSAPAVASRGPGLLDVFFRGPPGDEALWRYTYDSQWLPWERLGGKLKVDPAAISWGAGRLDIFMRSPYEEVYQLTLP